MNENIRIAQLLRTQPVGSKVEIEEDLTLFSRFIDKTLAHKLNTVLDNEFVRIRYTEAVDLLLKPDKKFDLPVRWGVDLQSEHERHLTD